MSDAITTEQLDILRHTLGLNERGSTDGGRRNWFATMPDSRDGQVCQRLVAVGLMEDCGLVRWTPGEHVYRATDAGRQLSATSTRSRRTMTRAQRRYAEFLACDSGLSFGAWIKVQQEASKHGEEA